MINASSCNNQIALDSLESADRFDREAVQLVHHKPYGDVFCPFEGQKIEYQLLVGSDVDVAEAANLSEEHFVLACDNSGQILRALEQSQSGYWYAPNIDEDDELGFESSEFDEAFSGQFPNLDYRKMGLFRVRKPLPLWGYGFAVLMSIGSLVAIPLTAVTTYRKFHKDQVWRQKLHEDRTASYRTNPSAMRLVGATQFMKEPFPVSRLIDVDFDVAINKKKKHWHSNAGLGL